MKKFIFLMFLLYMKNAKSYNRIKSKDIERRHLKLTKEITNFKKLVQNVFLSTG